MIRAFFALDLPDVLSWGCIEAQAALRQSLGNQEGVTLVPPHKLHLTLCFLGDTEENTLASLVLDVKNAVKAWGEVLLQARGLGGLPPRRPHVLSLFIEANPRLLSLAAALSQLGRNHGLLVEERAYLPHITLARFKREEWARLPENVALPLGGTSENLLLFSSTLAPGGARHEVLARFSLRS